MPWMEQTIVSKRSEFCALASQEGANVAALCRRAGISRKTGYKWLKRQEEGSGLIDRSRRPQTSPRQTAAAIEEQVLAMRVERPDEGGRKIRRRLQDQGEAAVPAPSTITAILHRHDQIDPAVSRQHIPTQRFEAEAPNALWQMDFKGWVLLGRVRCHPLVILDDCSRFVVGLTACADQQGETVFGVLEERFRRYGMPWTMLCDNGAPWGSVQANGGITTLSARLIRLGIRVIHGRPYHPQTQGKTERFNRTFGAAVLATNRFPDLAAAQQAFDVWRADYNEDRPHEALDLATPLSRYRPSLRDYPAVLPELVYEPGDDVRAVGRKGDIWLAGTRYYVSEALAGESVGIRPTQTDGVQAVYYAHQRVRTIDLRTGRNV